MGSGEADTRSKSGDGKKIIAAHWFRQDLRLHDNPALLKAIDGCDEFYPLFIFDGKVASTENSHFHRIRFLHESLECLDESLIKHGGRLYCLQGETIETLRMIFQEWGINRLTYQEEPEAIWRSRDDAIRDLCEESGIERISAVGHTLWDPHSIITANGGTPPLTYAIFNHVTNALGNPLRPVDDPEFKESMFAKFDPKFALPSFKDLGFSEEASIPDNRVNKWKGGEKMALKLTECRLSEEAVAFSSGYVMPNHYLPDLCSPPKSMSAHLKFGCISVRRFYWAIQDTYKEAIGLDKKLAPEIGIVAQLIWREYFYTMSAQNIYYGQMEKNPICLQIPWYKNEELNKKIELGETGYPFVDAIMNQLRLEGWVHHVGRHMIASYITRGDLWLSWEVGVAIFEKYLIDYDWSICAGNWMWVSSSAFERALDCPKCFDPVKYGQRMDPNGEYIRRYVPALRKMPLKYLFQPWLAPRRVQEVAECIVGKDYPIRINDHKESSRENSLKMDKIRHEMSDNVSKICAPSNHEELRQFVWLPDHMATGSKCTGDTICEGIAGL